MMRADEGRQRFCLSFFFFIALHTWLYTGRFFPQYIPGKDFLFISLRFRILSSGTNGQNISTPWAPGAQCVKTSDYLANVLPGCQPYIALQNYTYIDIYQPIRNTSIEYVPAPPLLFPPNSSRHIRYTPNLNTPGQSRLGQTFNAFRINLSLFIV